LEGFDLQKKYNRRGQAGELRKSRRQIDGGKRNVVRGGGRKRKEKKEKGHKTKEKEKENTARKKRIGNCEN